MKDITGNRFGRLVAMRQLGMGKNSNRMWLAVCDCGNKKIIGIRAWGRDVYSCGCLRREILRNKLTTHGKTGTPTYRVWKAMRTRCNNPNTPHYKNYGGRGVKVCKRWERFENFFKDMGEKPKNKTLDRVNNNGNYEPQNCRWATRQEQSFNKRNTIFVDYKGTRVSLFELSKISGLNYRTLYQRFYLGYPEEKLIMRIKK